MKVTSNNLSETMHAQLTELLARILTVQAMADGRPDTPDDTRRTHHADSDDELAAPYSDPTAAAVVAQAGARSVLADFAILRRALASASAGARILVPKVIPLCAGCGEPVGIRKSVTWHGDVYHVTPCEQRARRAQKKAG